MITYKIINALRILSILVLTVVFFIAYAGLPEQVLVLLDNKGYPSYYMPRDTYFYSIISLLILSNALIYLLGAFLRKISTNANNLPKIIIALPIVTNVFFIVSLSLIGVMNGQENFDYTSFTPIMLASIVLFILWVFWLITGLSAKNKTV